MKEFFRNPNSQPVELKENDIFQYGSSDEDCHNNHGISSSSPHTEERLENSVTSRHNVQVISPYGSHLEESQCLSESDGLSQKSPLPELHNPSSKHYKLMSNVSREEQLKNYVVEFQRISTESLVSRISAFIPLLEKIKVGKVSLKYVNM